MCRAVLLPGYASILPGAGRMLGPAEPGHAAVIRLICSISTQVGVEEIDVHLAACEYSRTC